MIVLDTNVVSELMRPRPDAVVVSWLAMTSAAALYITAITEAGLRYGVMISPFGRRRDRMAAEVEGMLREDFAGRLLPFDSAAATAFAEIAAGRRAAGRPISQSDCQIAAIARSRHATIATRDIAGFVDCGLEIIDPWRPAATL